MRIPNIPFLRRFIKDERGQTAVLITAAMLTISAMSAMGIETGHVYYAYRLLQASTNAAVLAAGEAMPNIGTSSDSMTSGSAYGNLYDYSSESGALNANSLLTKAKFTSVSFSCDSNATNLNVFCEENSNSSGTLCVGSGSTSWCNAVAATQQATVPLWFGGLLGMKSMTISATAHASMAGGHPPYNIAVIIDTTSSMTGGAYSGDGCPSGSDTQIGCAVYGLEQMLIQMHPCLSSGTCTSNTEEADGVALFVFPAIQTTASNNYTSDDTVCNTSNPPIEPYGFENLSTTPASSNLYEPVVSATFSSTNTYEVSQTVKGKVTTTPAGATYQVTGFDTAYKTTNGASSLVTTDPLAVASGASGSKSCSGLQAPGGEGTYYAEAIIQAQEALIAQQSYMLTTYGQPTTNVMIILSDGDANACNTQAYVGGGAQGNTSCNNGSAMVALNCPGATSSVVGGKTVAGCTSTAISQNGASVTLNCPSGGCSGIPLNGTGTSTTNPAGTNANGCYGYNCDVYPSALGQCGQAVWAAQQATAAGTIVYTVAMGAETTSDSSDCGTDRGGYTLSGLSNGAATWPSGAGNGGQASLPAGSPCNAIAAMASSDRRFYSDDQNGCKSTENGAFESMASIFTDVTKHLSTSRLIP